MPKIIVNNIHNSPRLLVTNPTLDLHGLTIEEVEELLSIQASHNRACRALLLYSSNYVKRDHLLEDLITAYGSIIYLPKEKQVEAFARTLATINTKHLPKPAL